MRKSIYQVKKYHRLFYVLLLAVVFIPAYSQAKKDDIIYLFNKDWGSAKNMNEASFFMQLIKENDSSYTCRYYNKFGPMIRQEVFLDSGLTIPNGIFCWYGAKGNLDSTATFYRGRKNGFWGSYDNNSKRKISVLYKMDRIAETRDYLLNTYADSSGTVINLKEKEKAEHDAFVADSLAGKLQTATFGVKNSDKEWQRYLDKKIVPTERFSSIVKTGCCTVVCSFSVDAGGNINEVYLMHSCEWSSDTEVINEIQNAPKWNPAIQNGKAVNYRQMQAISFCAGDN